MDEFDEMARDMVGLAGRDLVFVASNRLLLREKSFAETRVAELGACEKGVEVVVDGDAEKVFWYAVF